MSVVGPVALAVGLVVGNEVLVLNQPVIVGTDWNPKVLRPIVGGVIAGGILSLVSNFLPRTAELFAWTMVVGVALVRIDKTTPSPAESLLSWYNATPPASGIVPQPARR
jgi:hypothetical protein